MSMYSALVITFVAGYFFGLAAAAVIVHRALR